MIYTESIGAQAVGLPYGSGIVSMRMPGRPSWIKGCYWV